MIFDGQFLHSNMILVRVIWLARTCSQSVHFLFLGSFSIKFVNEDWKILKSKYIAWWCSFITDCDVLPCGILYQSYRPMHWLTKVKVIFSSRQLEYLIMTIEWLIIVTVYCGFFVDSKLITVELPKFIISVNFYLSAARIVFSKDTRKLLYVYIYILDFENSIVLVGSNFSCYYLCTIHKNLE